MSENKIAVNITSAIAIGGEIIQPGSKKAKGLKVDEALAKNLLQRGKAELATVVDDDDADKALDEMTVTQLKKLAKDLDIDGADGLKKAELIAAIEEAETE